MSETVTYTETIGNIGDLFVLASLGIYQKIKSQGIESDFSHQTK